MEHEARSSSDRLGNADRAEVDIHKLTNYLLNDVHPQGAAKSRFLRSFGYTLDDVDTLTEALIEHAGLCPARKVDSTAYGDKWVVEGPFRGRDGRRPTIRTVWQYDHGSDIPRFITLVPVD